MNEPYSDWHALCARAAARGYSLSRGSAPGRAWYSLAPLEDRRPERVVRVGSVGEVEAMLSRPRIIQLSLFTVKEAA